MYSKCNEMQRHLKNTNNHYLKEMSGEKSIAAFRGGDVLLAGHFVGVQYLQ